MFVTYLSESLTGMTESPSLVTYMNMSWSSFPAFTKPYKHTNTFSLLHVLYDLSLSLKCISSYLNCFKSSQS